VSVPDRPDAIVVGAGIVGVACAAALARDGLRVTIVDRSFAASGTTSVGMGHVVAMDDSPEQLALTAYAHRLWRELSPYLDARSELDACGTLWVAEDPGQLPDLLGKQQVYAAAGVDSEVLDGRGLAQAEPNLRHGLAGALRVGADSVVYPPGVTLRLLDIARSYGAVLREGVEVREIIPNGVRCATETLHADIVVNAKGPPRHHRPVSRVLPPSDCGAGLPCQRAGHDERIGGVQCSAALHGAGAHRIFT
jgi:glycine/D-amino acid oxidase-like deaminating enzyme